MEAATSHVQPHVHCSVTSDSVLSAGAQITPTTTSTTLGMTSEAIHVSWRIQSSYAIFGRVSIKAPSSWWQCDFQISGTCRSRRSDLLLRGSVVHSTWSRAIFTERRPPISLLPITCDCWFGFFPNILPGSEGWVSRMSSERSFSLIALIGFKACSSPVRRVQRRHAGMQIDS